MNKLNRINSLLISVVVCACWLSSGQASAQAPTLTTVSDIVYRANGQPAAGTIEVSWASFSTADNRPVASGQVSVPIGTDGSVSVQLAPNVGATPTVTYYKTVYKLTDGTTSTEYWVVPTSSPTT